MIKKAVSNQKWKLDNSATWKKYKVRISDDLVNGILSHLPKRFERKQVKFYITIMITELIDNFSKLDYETCWYFNKLGRFNISIKPKISYIFEKPRYLYDVKRVKFDFRTTFKTIFIKQINKENEKVLEWLEEKRKNREFIYLVQKNGLKK